MRVRFAQEFGASLFDIETANELKDALKQASQRMGFDYFALSLEARTSDDADTEMLLHDYPDEWAKVYTSLDLAGRDPVRRACDKAFGGFTWAQTLAPIVIFADKRTAMSCFQPLGE